MPSTTDVVVRRDMMTMSETKTNDTMKKTEITMDDASECVSARACGSHAPWRVRTHDAKPVASEQSKNPCNAHALIASLYMPSTTYAAVSCRRPPVPCHRALAAVAFASHAEFA